MEKCDKGVFGTMAEAFDELSTPRVKPVKPIASYKGQLQLGDPEKYESAMCIDVERYPKTRIKKPLTASNFVPSSEIASGESQVQLTETDRSMAAVTAGGLAAVKSARTYKVIDESAPGGKRDVEREELAKGYEYGRTAVHISESDENVTKLETTAGFTILGFVPSESVCTIYLKGLSLLTVSSMAST